MGALLADRGLVALRVVQSDSEDEEMIAVIDGPAILDTNDLGPHRDADGVIIACQTCAHYSPNSRYGCALEYKPCDSCADWERCDVGCDKTRCGDCPLTEIESLL